MDADTKLECYEEYFGDRDEMKKRIDECSACGAKLVFSHLPDYKSLIIQETARCMDCGKILRKVVSVLH